MSRVELLRARDSVSRPMSSCLYTRVLTYEYVVCVYACVYMRVYKHVPS